LLMVSRCSGRVGGGGGLRIVLAGLNRLQLVQLSSVKGGRCARVGVGALRYRVGPVVA